MKVDCQPHTKHLIVYLVDNNYMQISINGKYQELKKQKSIAEIIAELGIKGDFIAVAINSAVINKKKYNETLINEGDKVEIIHPVQGG